MDNISKLSISKTMKYFTKYNKKTIGDKISVLEPISTIIKLGLLYYKSSYSKISIMSHKIHIQEPFVTQGLSRYINNDKRADIAKLYIPILKAIEKYQYNLREIFILCTKGLINLKQCYVGEDNIHVMIDSYINLLTNCVTNSNRISCSSNNNPFENESVEKDTCDRPIINTNNNIDTIRPDTTEESSKCSLFVNIWKNDDIDIVNKYLGLIDESREESIRHGYVEVIEKIIQVKETISEDIINKAYQLF